MMPLVSLVGKSETGKTTLLVKLLPELKQRGLRVAVIKHHAHATPIDPPGKDSYRMSEAGADLVAVSSPAEFVRFQRVRRELTLAEIAAQIEGVDLILSEGFKREPGLKIEVSRAAISRELLSDRTELIAVASDHAVEAGVPQFGLEDAPGLADFIVNYFGLGPQAS